MVTVTPGDYAARLGNAIDLSLHVSLVVARLGGSVSKMKNQLPTTCNLIKHLFAKLAAKLVVN